MEQLTLVTPNLTEKVTGLYMRTCWPGNGGNTPSKELIKDIEEFVDELARVYSPVIDVGVTEQQRPQFGLDFVNKVTSKLCVERRCLKTYDKMHQNRFLPQLYHILGDYGLLQQHLTQLHHNST